MSDDIALNITCDIAELTAGLKTAGEQMRELAEVATQQSERVAASLTGQSFVATVRADTKDFVKGIRDARAEVTLFTAEDHAGMFGDTAWKDAKVSFGKIVEHARESAAAVTRIWESVRPNWMGSNEAAAVSPQQPGAAATGGGQSAPEQSTSMFRQAADAAATAMNTAASAATAWLAYEVVIKETTAAMAVHLKEGSQFREMVGSLTAAAYEFGGALTGPVVEGLRASMNAALQWATGFGSLTEMVDAGIGTLTSWGNTAATALKSATQQAQSAAAVFTTALAIWHGADADAFSAEGQALTELATKTEAVIAKQQKQQVLFHQLRAAQDSATATATQNLELQRIGAIDSIEAIDREVAALRDKAAAAILSGKATEDSQKKEAALFLALANQRNAVTSGKMDKPKKSTEAESAIANAEAQLRRLSIGQDEAAVSAIIAAGANVQEVETLRELQAQTAELNAEQKRKEKQGTMRATADSTIASMMDEIDLLTNSATKAEIAMRKMAREGFDADQVAQVGELTAEMERLQAEKDAKEPKGKKGKEDSPLKAAFVGSSEAASIMLRGLGGKSMEQIASKQLAVQQQTLAAIKDNKQPAIQPLSLGT